MSPLFCVYQKFFFCRSSSRSFGGRFSCPAPLTCVFLFLLFQIFLDFLEVFNGISQRNMRIRERHVFELL